MSIKCCGQLKKRKGGDILTVLELAERKTSVETSALRLSVVLEKNIKILSDRQLRALSNSLQQNMLVVTTESARRDGLKTCCGSIHKPINVEIPGVGNCAYTGD